MPPIQHRQVLTAVGCGLIIAASAVLFVCALVGFTLLDQEDGEEEATETVAIADASPVASQTIEESPFFLVSPTVFVPTFTPLVLNNPPAEQPPIDLDLHPTTGYQIVVIKRGEDSLFVVNQTPNRAFTVGPLQLGNDMGIINGAEWGVGALAPGTCVTAWKDGGNPEAPEIDCITVGESLVRDGPSRFWKETFNVFYNGALIGDCSGERCLFNIPG